jgi:hypothetical protein
MRVTEDKCVWAITRALVLTVIGLVGLPLVVAAQAGSVTFARDVAPILQASCQTCHREGGMGPMELLTYEDAKTWAPIIKDKVEHRRMPPWYIEKGVGIQDFKNDISLTDKEIKTVVDWVDAGAPFGDAADEPDPVVWDDSRGWKLEDHFGRPPDLIVASPTYSVPEAGLDHWFEPSSTVDGITEPRWAKATEIRPGTQESRYVFHHANSNLASSAAGKDYDLYPDDAGKLIRPGQTVNWAMHFFPAGIAVPDAFIELGIWLYPAGERPEMEVSHASWRTDEFANSTVLSQGSSPGRFGRRSGRRAAIICDADAGVDCNRSNEVIRASSSPGCWAQPATAALDGPECHVQTRLTGLALPPHGVATQQGVHVLTQALRLNSIRGHMHMRGKYQTIEAIYPDGRREYINRINWDHKWHTAHAYEDHAAPLLPKGTTLIVTAQYDNTVNNPNNPDPDQWVFFGRRSADEMGHFHVEVTWLEEEQYERLVKERMELNNTMASTMEE